MTRVTGTQRRAMRALAGASRDGLDWVNEHPDTIVAALGHNLHDRTSVEVFYRCAHGYGVASARFRDWYAWRQMPTRNGRERKRYRDRIAEIVLAAVRRDHRAHGLIHRYGDAPEFQKVVAL